jgi:hypothetical protein
MQKISRALSDVAEAIPKIVPEQIDDVARFGFLLNRLTVLAELTAEATAEIAALATHG